MTSLLAAATFIFRFVYKSVCAVAVFFSLLPFPLVGEENLISSMAN
jgi:hypothetical protein